MSLRRPMVKTVDSSKDERGFFDPLSTWEQQYGEPLLNALKWIAHWRMEARLKTPREITYQEFYFRVTTALWYESNRYHMNEGVAEVIAQMGTPGILQAASDTALDNVFGPAPRLHYELARHIARTNRESGFELPHCLCPFADAIAVDLKRPRGPDTENRRLFKTLAWWGVDHAAQLGLHPTQNRMPTGNRRDENGPPACQLVSDVFMKAGLGQITLNSVIDAWEAHKHRGTSERKRLVKSHVKAYKHRFHEIDELVWGLPQFLK